ncbi:Spy/CpxP family protein refolding chaperone [Aliikangiella sp. IMCC44653]
MNLAKSIAVVALSGFLFSTAVSAGPHHKGHGDKQQHRTHRMLEALDLTEAQQAEVKKIHSEGKDDRKAQHKQMKSLKKQLHGLLQAEQIDEGAIKAVSLQMAEQKADMLINKARKKQRVYALLTPEQQQKWQAIELKKQAKKNKKMRKHQAERAE